MNRQMIDDLADLYFAPTQTSASVPINLRVPAVTPSGRSVVSRKTRTGV